MTDADSAQKHEAKGSLPCTNTELDIGEGIREPKQS
jgi:hypothetical protein